MLRRLLLTAAVSATAALSAVPSAIAGTPTVDTLTAGTSTADTPTGAPAAPPVPTASPAPAASPLYTAVPAGPPALSAASLSAAYGVALPALMPPPARPDDSQDRLTVTVHGVGGGADGTFELECHPAGGSHPDAAEACDRLDRMTTWGKDTFAPVPPDTLCTMQYGGPATAHVTGTWAGRTVDARYDRSDGCEISRWNALVPLLPGARP
ncbi:SSI family serine proteinase inhibitor [Streptomyces sp. NPDC002935]|uniref:SSI family serine proteinase inhibitor n=1 Tax=unclassified Streptomyces TaxID=2593676 RepID=UPI00331C7C9E